MALPEIVQSSLTDYFRMVQSEVHQFTAPLSTEQIWRKPYPYGNSIGNLILHLSGNFNYYIGTQLAGTEYVRHRPREFTDTGQPKEDLIRDFDAATEIVLPLRRSRVPPRRPNHLFAKGTAEAELNRTLSGAAPILPHIRNVR
jgi:hypothetical protein